ncbi:MAG: glycerol kinase GlpK [Gammaproteobacteria bacterium]
MKQYILAIDQGTTSTRAIIFDKNADLISQAQIELNQYYPKSGWVEHDPEEIWNSTIQCCKNAMHSANLSSSDILAIGITNQRETTLIWDKETGTTIYPAIVWQDRRTADYCKEFNEYESIIFKKTGLLLDAYFSVSKIAWLLNHIPNVREKAENGKLAFGTIETFLLWRLTKGKVHATDITNASRTSLMNIETGLWDQELLNLFDIPESILPSIYPNCAEFGTTDVLGENIPILGMAGDQQAALIGQTCFKQGMLKSTYGTGAFLLLNTGDTIVRSQHRLLTTIAYQINQNICYGLEGSIFIAGAAIKWLCNELKIINTPEESEMAASNLHDNGGVYFIPAFSGLGAPYWQPEARGAIFGLSHSSHHQYITRAALEAVCYQTKNLIELMHHDCDFTINNCRVDGGMVQNNWFLQFLTDILSIDIVCPEITETTALGAAFLAGLQAGLFTSLEELPHYLQSSKKFTPQMSKLLREEYYQKWLFYVEKLMPQ